MNEKLFNKIATRLGLILFLIFVILESYLICPGFAFFVSWMIGLVFILYILLRDLNSRGIKICLI